MLRSTNAIIHRTVPCIKSCSHISNPYIFYINFKKKLPSRDNFTIKPSHSYSSPANKVAN